MQDAHVHGFSFSDDVGMLGNDDHRQSACIDSRSVRVLGRILVLNASKRSSDRPTDAVASRARCWEVFPNSSGATLSIP